MGRYAIVFVLAKNLASGTQRISATLAPALKDDKGRIYDYSDPLTTERLAMIYATWEFSVGKTVFDDINPGVETPLLMLWDVNEDALNRTLTETCEAQANSAGPVVDVSGYIVDVADATAVAATAAAVLDEVGPIDVLVNNAGVVRGNKYFWETDLERDTKFTIDVNTLAPMYVCLLYTSPSPRD